MCSSTYIAQENNNLAAPKLLDVDLTIDEMGTPVLTVEIPQDFGASSSSEAGTAEIDEKVKWSLLFPEGVGAAPGKPVEMEPSQPPRPVVGTSVFQLPQARLPSGRVYQGLILKANQHSRGIETFYLAGRAESGDGDAAASTLLMIVSSIAMALFILLLILIWLQWPLTSGAFRLPSAKAKEGERGSRSQQNPAGQPSSSVPKDHIDPEGQILNLENLLRSLDARLSVGLGSIFDAVSMLPELRVAEQTRALLEQFKVSSGQWENFKSEYGREIREVIRGELRGVPSMSAGSRAGGDDEFSRQWLDSLLKERLADLCPPADRPFRSSQLTEQSPRAVAASVARAAVAVDSDAVVAEPPGAFKSRANTNHIPAARVQLADSLSEDLAAFSVRVAEANSATYVQALQALGSGLSAKLDYQGFRIWFARISQAATTQGWLIQEVMAVEEGVPRFRAVHGAPIISEDVWQVMLAVSEEGTGRQPLQVALLFSWSRLEKGAPSISRYLADWPNTTLRPELVRCTRPALLEWSNQAAGYIVSKKLGLMPIDREIGGIGGE